jgi:hypothetical protein
MKKVDIEKEYYEMAAAGGLEGLSELTSRYNVTIQEDTN